MQTQFSGDQQDKIGTFISFTGCSTNQAIRYLKKFEWKIDEASDAFFENPPKPEFQLNEEAVNTLFQKYAEQVTNEKDVLETLVRDKKLFSFFVTLGIDPDSDLSSLVLPWQFGCKTPFVITKAEFFNGFKKLQCDTMPALKEKINQVCAQLHDDLVFREFYKYIFVYAAGIDGKKYLKLEYAVTMWRIVLKDQFSQLEAWIQFCEVESKPVNQDCWNLLLDFSKSWPRGYDPNDAWPVIFDNFVEWNSKKKSKALENSTTV